MSGFVYKVRVNGQTLIKKEIPGPDTVDEFLYEVNALYALGFSQSVVDFYGVVIDDDENVKGLLISYAENGALVDIIYDSQERGPELSWATREKWAKQIVRGLSDIHEAGFVQGDFTLSNIVIDSNDDARIIDINRRGCPVGWEPPEATPLINSNQRISMYIGVKSDLYQLGMVLWALATLDDEPEAQRRPLRLDPEIEVPPWCRRMVEICLHNNPRYRQGATALLTLFPESENDDPPTISVEDGHGVQEYAYGGNQGGVVPIIRTVEPQEKWRYNSDWRSASSGVSEGLCYYPPRGRSPPSPAPYPGGDRSSQYLLDRVWTNDTGHSTSQRFDNRVDTPHSNRGKLSNANDDLARDIENIERELQTEAAIELAQTTGGESQITEALPKRLEENTGHAPMVDGVHPPGTVGTLDSHGASAAVDYGEPGANTDRPRTMLTAPLSSHDEGSTASAQMGTTVPSEAQPVREEGTQATRTSGNSSNQPDDEKLNEKDGNYTYDRKQEGPARTTEAMPSLNIRPWAKDSPPLQGELAGVGSRHDRDTDLQSPSIPDEDLGLVPTSAQNVTT
jgi:serine/threonine protein kinase